MENTIFELVNCRKYKIVWIISCIFLIFGFFKFLNLSRNNQDEYLHTNFRNLNNKIVWMDGVFEKLQQNILIEPFLIEINNKEFKGNWTIDGKINANTANDLSNNVLPRYKNYFSDFVNKQGEISIKFFIETKSIDYKKIILDMDIKDGKYKERWINIKQEYSHYSSDNNFFRNDLNFKFAITNETIKTLVESKSSSKLESYITRMSLYQIKESFCNYIYIIISNSFE